MDEQTKRILDDILAAKPIAFRPIFKEITGNTNAALFLSQAWYWSKKDAMVSRDGWFYKTIEECQEETKLSRREQDTAIRICKKNGFLETDRRKAFSKGSPFGHATRWFRVNKDNVYKSMERYYSDVSLHKPANQSLYETYNHDCTNPPNYLTENTNKESSSSSEVEPILIFYKQEFGKVTPTIQEKLLTAKETYSEEWVLEALTEAITYNKPSWAYAETILKRWKQEGKTKTKGVRHANRQTGSSTGKRSSQNPPAEPTPADLEAARRAMAKRKLKPNQKRL